MLISAGSQPRVGNAAKRSLSAEDDGAASGRMRKFTDRRHIVRNGLQERAFVERRGIVRDEPKADETERQCSIGAAAVCP